MSKKYQYIQKTTEYFVGATFVSPGNLGTKLYRQRRLFFVFFENRNNCSAIVARAANRRPYGI